MTEARRIVHLVVPKMADELPEEVKNAVVSRRELFAGGRCPNCKRELPTGEQLSKYFDTTRGIVDPAIRQGIVSRYFEHADFCRGHVDRLQRIAKKHELTLADLGFEIWSFDLDAREVVRADPLPEGTQLDEVLDAYRKLVREREAS